MAKAIKVKAATRKAANKALYTICKQKHNAIPLQDIENVLNANGITLVDEAGQAWTGFIMGEEGTTSFELGLIGSEDERGFFPQVTNCLLAFQWHKFETGRYEINCYLS